MVPLERITRDFITALAFASVLAASRCAVAQSNAETPAPALPTIQEMVASRTDVWGDAAMRQPNGASYEFFKDLLPPLRWVNTQVSALPHCFECAASCAKGAARFQRKRREPAGQQAADVD